MTVKEFLAILNTKDISTYAVNGITKSFFVLRSTFGEYEIDNVTVSTKIKDLTVKDCDYQIVTNVYDPDHTLIKEVDLSLPKTSVYVAIMLDFKLKGE